MKNKKLLLRYVPLTSRGSTHYVIPLLIVLSVAIYGVYNLVSSHAASQTFSSTLQAESLTYTPSKYTFSTNKPVVPLWWTSTGTGTITLPAKATNISVYAYGTQCKGAPHMVVSVDNKLAFQYDITATAPYRYQSNLNFAPGKHTVSVAFINDYGIAKKCDRNLFVDKIVFTGPATTATPTSSAPVTSTPPTATPAPTASTPPKTAPAAPVTKLYVDTAKTSWQYVYGANSASWRASHPTETALLKKIADQPQAIWLGYGSDDQVMTKALSEAAADKSRVIFTLYNIPNRDNGQYASAGGGAKTADAYKAWIDTIAAKIGNKPTILIVEPDAVPMGITGQYRQEALLYAATKLSALPDSKVYIDGGNSTWGNSPQTIADRLNAVGISKVTGFSLNVSNFNYTANEISYGKKVSALVGNKPFVVDTSINGNGPRPAPAAGTKIDGSYYWCNPPGRALGQIPTMNTGVAGVDAYLWISTPGNTNGACNGGPAQGFWLDRAVEIARNAQW